MRPYGPAQHGQDSRGNPWPLALAVFAGYLFWHAGMLPLIPQAAARPPSPHHGGGRAAHHAVAYAVAQVGKPYMWGAEGPGSFDCSGLTWAAWHAAGVDIPRTAAGQLEGLPRVHGHLQPGDLVVYATDGPTRRHVAMVIGPRRMVEARGHSIPVRVTRLRPGWLGAVRPGDR